MSQSAAARAVFLSPQSVGRLEKGESTRVSELHLTALLNFYRASADECEELLTLGRAARDARYSEGRWWSAYADLFPEGLDRVEFEQRAISVTMFGNVLVPPLLRTTDYCRAVESTLRPQESPTDHGRRVEMIARRQDRLRDRNFHLQVYMLEMVMRHDVGGPVAMNAQLSFLAEVSARPTVSIRVVPASAGSHFGLHTGSFTRLELGVLHPRRGPEPPMLYADGILQGRWVESASDIARYEEVLRDLDRVALSPNDSRTLMCETANSLWPVRTPGSESSSNGSNRM